MFSIIIPVWNRANVVGRAIESALSQTFKDYEIIIVDDGSQDELKKTINNYLSNDVSYFRIPHCGVSAARNYALERAKGDYIAYLDSDNRWHPNYLLKMWDALNTDDIPKKAAYCMYNLYKKDDKTGKIELDGVRGEQFDFKRLLVGNYIDVNTFIHSRDCISKIGLWDTGLRCLVDWDYIVRISAKFEPAFVSEVLVDYFLGVEENTLTFNESGEIAYDAVRRKNVKYEHPVTLCHDSIEYRWEDVSGKKYYNWMRMTYGELDTTDFTANGFPYMLQIEPTNFCNLACPLCPAGRNEMGRERRHMTLEEFKSIVDDLENYLLFLIMWSWGEPFMNPNLPAMIRYAKEKGIKTVTSTNGQFFTDESYLKDLLTSGLTTLIVAIDSLYEDNYGAYRKKGSLNKALGGLRRAVELKRELGSETHINMRMVVMKQNEHELDSLRRMARCIGVDRFSVKTVNPSCDSSFSDEGIVPENPRYRRYEYMKGSYQRVKIDSTCGSVWSMCGVHSNGDIVPCCYDYNGQMKVGNIHYQKISEVWNGLAFRELRKKITCDRNSIARCKECGINFKLSESGWFVESLDLNEERLRKKEEVKNLKDQLEESKSRLQESGSRIEQLENEIAEMKKSLVWQLLMRYQGSFVESALPRYTRRRILYDQGLKLGRSLVNRK